MKGRIDQFTIIKNNIGSGSYAIVVLVENPDDHQRYAVKVFKKCDSVTLQSLDNEFSIISDLNATGGHPNILRVYSCRPEAVLTVGTQQQQRIVMVMEHIRGLSLFEIMNKMRASFHSTFARAYFRMLLDGLEFMHNKGYCHLDVKLDNAMLAQNGGIKLVDFGFSSRFTNHTNLTSIKGSPHYEAPQVRQGNYNGAKADLYAAGVTLFLMSVFSYPFGNRGKEHIPSQYQQFVHNKAAFWQKFKLQEDPHRQEWKQLIEAMIDPNANNRPSIAQIRQSPWYLHTPEPSPAELQQMYVGLCGEPMEIEPPGGESGSRSVPNPLVEKYLATLKIDDGNFYRVTELQPTSIVFNDTPESFVAKLMVILLEKDSGQFILADVDYERFHVKLSETEPLVMIRLNQIEVSVDYCSGITKGTQQFSIVMAYDAEDRLVLDFRQEEDGINPEDLGRIRLHVTQNLKVI